MPEHFGILLIFAAIWAMTGTMTIQEELYNHNLREIKIPEFIKYLLHAIFYGPYTKSKVIPKILKKGA